MSCPLLIGYSKLILDARDPCTHNIDQNNINFKICQGVGISWNVSLQLIKCPLSSCSNQAICLVHFGAYIFYRKMPFSWSVKFWDHISKYLLHGWFSFKWIHRVKCSKGVVFIFFEGSALLSNYVYILPHTLTFQMCANSVQWSFHRRENPRARTRTRWFTGWVGSRHKATWRVSLSEKFQGYTEPNISVLKIGVKVGIGCVALLLWGNLSGPFLWMYELCHILAWI